MLRDEVEQYTKLTGEDGWHVPIIRVGAYLDGYNKGLEMLDKIRAEIEEYKSRQLTLAIGVEDLEKGKQIALEYVLAIIDKYKAENEGEECL